MRSSGAFIATLPAFPSRSLLLRLAAASLALASCGEAGPPRDAPPPLRFGLFIADAAGSREQLAARYQPVVTYFATSLARPIELVVSRDAGNMLAEFEAGRFDVLFHRAFGFPHAQEHAGAVPLVTRAEDRRTTSVFLALATDSRKSLQEFRGGRVAFSVRLGSSYVMGRHYLEQQQIDLETFFHDVHFSSVADEAVARLRRGQADLCVANSEALLRMLASGVLRAGEVKVIAETPPHVGQLWFASDALPEDVHMQVRDAFLALSTEDPEQAAVLKLLVASAFLPATHDDYRQLTDLMRQMQLLDIDMSQLR